MEASSTRWSGGRITGWGRSGPLALSAGHDINYISLTGALHACGTLESGPIPPLNLLGDYGGGGFPLALGVVCALLQVRASGRGQIVDAAMIDGAATLMAAIYGLRGSGNWPASRAGNLLDGSAYFYTCYQCAGSGWVAVGALEPQFRRELLRLLGLESEVNAIMSAPDNDPAVRGRLAGIFRSRTRSQWTQVFDGSDACVSPVLEMSEVMEHPQNRARGAFAVVDGVLQPQAALHFSSDQPPLPGNCGQADARNARVKEWGPAAELE
jgi:alpha-methylacyl-CoA racemase